MYEHNLDPVALSFYGLRIYWYSLAYIVGFLFTFWYSKKLIKKKVLNLNFEIAEDFISIGILTVILGGRFGYVFFYNFEYYLINPVEIIKIWKGGMSFHGGLLGVIIASILFAKKNDQNFFNYLDIVSITAPIGIFFGRIANFINSELYGIETKVPWAVKFTSIDDLYRHPTQLYEAFFEGFVLFIILIYFWKRGFMKAPGLISGLFLIFYSSFRFFIEFLRVPDEQLGYMIFNLTMGQIISVVFLLFGSYLIVTKYENKKKN